MQQLLHITSAMPEYVLSWLTKGKLLIHTHAASLRLQYDAHALPIFETLCQYLTFLCNMRTYKCRHLAKYVILLSIMHRGILRCHLRIEILYCSFHSDMMITSYPLLAEALQGDMSLSFISPDFKSLVETLSSFSGHESL